MSSEKREREEPDPEEERSDGNIFTVSDDDYKNWVHRESQRYYLRSGENPEWLEMLKEIEAFEVEEECGRGTLQAQESMERLDLVWDLTTLKIIGKLQKK